MKQLIISIIIILLSLIGYTQSKDTTVQVTLKLNEYRAVLNMIDANFDSKKTITELIEFLQKHTAILPPKQDEKEKPKK